MVEAILLKPLDGKPAGTRREFSQADFDRLKALGAVREYKGSAKAAPEPQNKMAPPVDNKAVGTAPRTKAKK